jgi:imidazolonepropionase-like amidohydrolase
MILHATYMDETAVQAVIDHKVPLVPTFTFQANLADYGEAIGADSTLQAIFREEIVQSAGPLTEVFKAGIPILSGSESGFSLTPYGHWHYRELKILETVLGMSALEAIQSATQHGAIALRAQGQLGVLAKGYLADLICVEGDVLSDLDCLGRPGTIRHIMKDGRWVDCTQPLPDTWSIPGWRVSEFSSEVLTRQRAEQALGPL